jgi:hypothetical protein
MRQLNSFLGGCTVALLAALAATWISPAGAEEPIPAAVEPAFAAEDVAFFEQQVQPILQAQCFKCHGAVESPKGKLRLTSRPAVLRGGDNGPAVSLESPDESLLLSAINYESFEMPPSGKLPQADRDVLAEWVRRGLPWTPGVVDEPEPTAAHGPPQVNDETRAHWAFQPVQRPALPREQDHSWARTAIDAFILSRLEASGLRPAAEASRQTLIRRATYDLTGLPPTPEEVATFLADDAPGAYERLIDRLLASPHYGERWGRHWLDLVRYAETNSYERDGPKPYVWRYRDWVIGALNADMPYDRFLIEQLAGDELADRTRESLIATGYYRLGIWDDEPVDAEQALYDDLDDVLSTTGQVMLGVTIGCARCHDHKLDPIPQRDYYSLLSFFAGVQRFGVRGYESIEAQSLRSIATPEEEAAQAAEVAAHEERVADNRRQMETIERLVRDDFSGVEREEFQNENRQLELVRARVPALIDEEQFAEYERQFREREALRQFRPRALEQALCVTEIGPQPRSMHVLVRGNPHAPGDEVAPAYLSVLPAADASPAAAHPQANTSGRRTALARWIASGENPLTARVMANRVWQYHFGRGIVRSSSNFGLTADRPTHPELLDYLAAELVAGGWRLKSLHRQIMLSAAYRMSSAADDAALAADPQNDLFWRFNPRRLGAEEVRDSILAVNGSLNDWKMGGESVFVAIPDEVLAGQSMPGAGWGRSPPLDERRRSIYIHVKRSLPPPVLAAFDAPETDFTCPVRFATTQPTQALGMLNSRFANEQAGVFADYLRAQVGSDAAECVRLCLRRTLQREPSDAEVERGVRFVSTAQSEHGASEEQALRLFCLVALNLNEFLYLD